MNVKDGQSLLHCAAVNDRVGAVMFIADCLQQFNINLKDKVTHYYPAAFLCLC